MCWNTSTHAPSLLHLCCPTLCLNEPVSVCSSECCTYLCNLMVALCCWKSLELNIGLVHWNDLLFCLWQQNKVVCVFFCKFWDPKYFCFGKRDLIHVHCFPKLKQCWSVCTIILTTVGGIQKSLDLVRHFRGCLCPATSHMPDLRQYGSPAELTWFYGNWRVGWGVIVCFWIFFSS